MDPNPNFLDQKAEFAATVILWDSQGNDTIEVCSNTGRTKLTDSLVVKYGSSYCLDQRFIKLSTDLALLTECSTCKLNRSLCSDKTLTYLEMSLHSPT